MRTYIHTITDLRRYVGRGLQNYDPYTWTSLGWAYDEYADEFTYKLLDLMKCRGFRWGSEIVVSQKEWNDIEKRLDEGF